MPFQAKPAPEAAGATLLPGIPLHQAAAATLLQAQEPTITMLLSVMMTMLAPMIRAIYRVSVCSRQTSSSATITMLAPTTTGVFRVCAMEVHDLQ